MLISEKISQSLAGRVVNNTLLPLSREELESARMHVEDIDLQMLTGFYPRIYNTEIEYSDFYPEYVSTYVQRDVRQMKNIGDLSLFEKFLQLLAGRVGQLLNLTSLSNDVGVTHNTIEKWISLLEASYIVFRLQPYYKNLGKRVMKSPKIYFHDTGVLCYLLGINSKKELGTHFAHGNIFENLVISEIIKKINNYKLPLKVYFYRDSNQVEIDLIVDSGSKVSLCEIKSAQTYNKEFVKNLTSVEEIPGVESHRLIVYKGENQQKVSKDIQLINYDNMSEILTSAS